jgi:monoamine oxidase
MFVAMSSANDDHVVDLTSPLAKKRPLQQKQAIKVDCAIIGAGAAGLQTAATLREAQQDDLSLVVVEARDRVGGRIWTTTETVTTVEGETVLLTRDLGAAWVHGTGGTVQQPERNPMVELLEEQAETGDESLLYPVFDGNAWTRPHTVLHQTEKIAMFVEGRAISNESAAVSQAIRQHYDLFKSMSKYADQLCESGEIGKMNELSVYQVQTEIQKVHQQTGENNVNSNDTTDEENLIDTIAGFYMFLLENWNGIAIRETQLSLVAGRGESVTDEHFSSEGDFDGPHCKIKSGMATILKPLLDKVDKNNTVHRNEPVHSVKQLENGSIEIRTSCTVVEAKCCVSTIPLGCLQSIAKEVFDPKLSDAKMEAVASIWSGAYKKVFLTFNRIFWPKDVPVLGLIRKRNRDETANDSMLPGSFLLATNLFAKNGIPSIEAVLCGDLGKWAFQKSDEMIQNAVLDFMECSMGLSNLREACTGCHITRWEEDEFTRGSYSTFRLGTKDSHVDDLKAAEWNGSLIFAGESTEDEHMGSVHGALTSGKRAAKEVLDYLSKKPSPEVIDLVDSSDDETRNNDAKRKGQFMCNISDKTSCKHQKTERVAKWQPNHPAPLSHRKEYFVNKPTLAVLEPGDDGIVTPDMLKSFHDYASCVSMMCLEASSSASTCSTVQHIQQRDNWSCGFRNLQMIFSAILPHVPANHVMFHRIPRRSPTPCIPSLLQLQQHMEAAWHEGFDANGARHYGYQMVGRFGHGAKIGAVDAANLLRYLGIDATVVQFIKCRESRSILSKFIKSYFSKQTGKDGCLFCCRTSCNSKISVNEILETTSWPSDIFVKPACQCPLLPLYLQWKGHSVTVVGFDEVGGEQYLLVFDPQQSANWIQSRLIVEKTLAPVRQPLSSFIHRDTQLVLCTLRSLSSNERYHCIQKCVVTAAQAAVNAAGTISGY